MKSRPLLAAALILALTLLAGFASRGATISVSCAPTCTLGEPATISGQVEHVNVKRLNLYGIRFHEQGTADWMGDNRTANMQADGSYSMSYSWIRPGVFDVQLVYHDHNPITLIVETTVEVVP